MPEKQQEKKRRPFINGFNIRVVQYKIEPNLNSNAKEKRIAANYIHSLHRPLVREAKVARCIEQKLSKKRFANLTNTGALT